VNLSVVIPTFLGREETYARALASYTSTLDGTSYEIITVKDKPNWPAACNEGYRQAKGDVILFTSHDLEALPGWHIGPLLHLSVHDELPAPRVYNFLAPPDGEWDNTEDGADGAIPEFTRIPIMRRDQYERIGEWPEIPYYADIWVSDKGRRVGIETRMVHGYDFIHHWCGIGRLDSRANFDASGQALRLLREQMK